MYQLCRHIKTNGQRCQSPALLGSAFCYFHSRVHTMAKAKSSTWEDIKLAPEAEICERGNCASCNRSDTCDDYDPEEEDEELTEENAEEV